MNREQTPVYKDIILAGGGHSHALVIRQWAMQPMPGVRLTLVSPTPLTPYSGMLPGLLAGHYRVADMHIDLWRLCRRAGVRFIPGRVEGLNPQASRLIIAGRGALEYDLLSLNTGSVPQHRIPGVRENAVAIKPVADFYRQWQQSLQRLYETTRPLHLVVVGGGAGSVEAILAMAHAIRGNPSINCQPKLTLLTQNTRILPEYPGRLLKFVHPQFRILQVDIETGFRVARVEALKLSTDDGRQLSCDQVFWCTDASAPAWLADAGLACTEKGFARVDACLRVSGRPDIFAAGDIAHFDPEPLPKAGVYAVRQAPVLFTNLRRSLLGRPLRHYRPQKRFLSLLSLGQRKALAWRAPFSAHGPWVWRWKDSIDRRFMAMFENLDMAAGQTATLAAPAVA
ncbi:MAG: FAD-dependent oxidoreductase, partial [Pseudohongiellaceae bacterium]